MGEVEFILYSVPSEPVVETVPVAVVVPVAVSVGSERTGARDVSAIVLMALLPT